jgi:hypothetical protein
MTFYPSSHSFVRYLERRGTMRTAFEFARLLLALDPWNDPQGAFMHMDFLAVKAEQYEWFLEIEEAWEEVRKEMPSLMPLSARPGWRWSKALVLRGLSVKKGGGEVCTVIDLQTRHLLMRLLETSKRRTEAGYFGFP